MSNISEQYDLMNSSQGLCYEMNREVNRQLSRSDLIVKMAKFENKQKAGETGPLDEAKYMAVVDALNEEGR